MVEQVAPPGPGRRAPGAPDSLRDQADSAHIYRLLPMHLLVHLDSALNDTTNSAEVVRALSRLQRGLCPRERLRGPCDNPDPDTWSSDNVESLSAAEQDAAIRAMRRWKLGMNRDTAYTPYEPRNQNRPGLPRIIEFLGHRVAEPVEPGTHRPWEHQSFRGKCKKGKSCEGKADPTEVFKAHLFRPNTYTVQMDGWKNLFLFGATAAPTDGWEVYSGIVVPAFRSQSVPVRFGGFVELHVGVTCGWECRPVSPTFGILYEAHRNSHVSWYAAGKWIPRRARVSDNPDAGGRKPLPLRLNGVEMVDFTDRKPGAPTDALLYNCMPAAKATCSLRTSGSEICRSIEIPRLVGLTDTGPAGSVMPVQ